MKMHPKCLNTGSPCTALLCVKILFIFVILLQKTNTINGSKYVSKNTIKDDELDKAKKYTKEKVDRLEEKLKPSTKTAKATESLEGDRHQKPVEWWDVQSHGKTTSELGLAIIVENYSKYRLLQPEEHHETGTIKMEPEDIYGGQYSVVAYEAGNYGLQGSVSWQIYHSHGEAPVKKEADQRIYGRRLNVAYNIPWSGSCDQVAGTRDGHSLHILHNVMRHNETTNEYKWKTSEANKLQKKWHTNSARTCRCKPKGPYHPQIYLEFELVDESTKQFQFLVHATMSGKACRPTLKVQFFPGMGPIGERQVYDFNEPIPPKGVEPHAQTPVHHTQPGDENSFYTKLFIYIASGVGFLAVALIVGVTCKKFVDKRRREDRFRRPYDVPRVYRSEGNGSGDEDEDDEVE